MKKKWQLLIGALMIILGIALVITFNRKDYSLSKIVSENNSCLTKGKECKIGLPLRIKVNKKDEYQFYVIKDDKEIVTLIMNENIGNNIEWTTGKSCNLGPDRLRTYIDELTKTWENIKQRKYTYKDVENCYEEEKILSKARLINYDELIDLGCEWFYDNTCPNYLYENLGEKSSGYWTMSSLNNSDKNAAYTINKNGNLSSSYVITDTYYGIRLVIEVEK